MKPLIETADGVPFNLLDPDPGSIRVGAVAHALSNLCRYTGHCSRFYSVAEHSIMVSRLVPPQYALEALLHDAPEAYIGDVSAPLKAMLPDYRAIEARVEQAVADAFDLDTSPECLAAIKAADRCALMTEARVLMPKLDRHVWGDLVDVKPCKMVPVVGYPPAEAKARFLERFWSFLPPLGA